MRHSILFIGVSALLLAGCDQLRTPLLASSAPAGGPGGNGGMTAPLAIFPTQVQLVVGGTAQLTSNAPTTLQSQVQWRSLQPAIAAVSPAGVVTAVAVGTAFVQARFAFDTTQTATATITVIGPPTSGTGGTAGGGSGG